MHDPEPAIPAKSSKRDVTHWLIWNIPGTSTGLPEGVAAGDLPDGSQVREPAQQRLHGPRRASRTVPSLHVHAVRARHEARRHAGAPADAFETRTALLNAMDGHVLGKAVLVARFHRQ